jgi:hypothetical protein
MVRDLNEGSQFGRRLDAKLKSGYLCYIPASFFRGSSGIHGKLPNAEEYDLKKLANTTHMCISNQGHHLEQSTCCVFSLFA